MPVAPEHIKIIEDTYKAMHAGEQGVETLMSLFADDAVWIEPFSGKVQTHNGKDAIRASLVEGLKQQPPDMKIVLDRADMDGSAVRADWTCTASCFPTPMRGYDLYTIVSGKITRLEIVVTDMPPMGPEPGT